MAAKELIAHIDQMFQLRGNIPSIQKLAEEEFYEYLLSYRAISDYPLIKLPEAYNELLENEARERYNFE